MKKLSYLIMGTGLVLSIAISNIFSVVSDGMALDSLRGSVLRLHILANSDSTYDQQLKLSVRDALLAHGDEIFGDAENFDEAEQYAEHNLALIKEIAEETLREKGCKLPVSAEITEMYFDDRTYGDITMPAGDYTALRVEIGKADGHNWWCVMYPPLCIPAACEDEVDDDKETEEEFFDDEQKDIIYHPEKYKVKFAVWEKIKSLTGK